MGLTVTFNENRFASPTDQLKDLLRIGQELVEINAQWFMGHTCLTYLCGSGYRNGAPFRSATADQRPRDLHQEGRVGGAMSTLPSKTLRRTRALRVGSFLLFRTAMNRVENNKPTLRPMH